MAIEVLTGKQEGDVEKEFYPNIQPVRLWIPVYIILCGLLLMIAGVYRWGFMVVAVGAIVLGARLYEAIKRKRKLKLFN